ncbi:reprolysin-like metallopeptidase [Chryseobacterium sp.]|uniref:reprolysin-like metallopeptidase n=1 Tax=Chryseobacterium sp. TaxID=1871047 RepID=UPI0028994758|nr:zinc-dependent metalloprotease family protein [Chryseobacterium sp.]
MKRTIFIFALMIPFFGFSQWTRTELRSQKVKKSQEKLEYTGLYSLSVDQLRQSLQKAPARFSSEKGAIISLPTASGKLESFQIWEYSNMAPELQNKFPDIKSYVGRGLEDPSVSLRFSFSPVGFSSMITRSGKSEFIEPYTEDRSVYAVFDSNAKKGQEKESFECTIKDIVEKSAAEKKRENVNKKTAGFNVFRLAMTCTGEYAQYHLAATGTPATATDAQKKAVILAAMNTSLTRMNGVFEKDLSLHFNLIANNDVLIFLDPATDPYDNTDNDYTNNFDSNGAYYTISARIPLSDYDMGHLVDRRNGTGVAGVGVICGNRKAAGYTAANFPEGSTFDIDYVAHEMGHQLGAGHSYTYRSSQADQKVEPGSGSTIMSYAGITGGSNDVQFNVGDYYHTNSITQIKNKINSIVCGINTPFANPAPNISAGADYTIPISTPFVLTATTTDGNIASYTYTWEQADQAAAAQLGANNTSAAYPTKPTGPTFRSLSPVTTPTRYFPDFNKVLGGVLSTRWESVSSIARELNFTATVRNNDPLAPQTNKDDVKLTVNAAAGPFQVTAPAFGQSLASGSAINVTWDVAGTNQAPINTANVNIKLSTNGGQTFTVIAANTPNDGSEQVTIPAGSTSSNAYILIEAVGNVYYAVSPSFVIDYNVTGETCTTYAYTGVPVAITDGREGGNISAPKVTVPLTVNNTGTITKIKVIPSITHNNVSDLTVGIESPVGSSAIIWNRACNNASNITATFSDTGNPVVCASPVQGETKSNESLGIFKGHTAQGTWKLFASDNKTGVAGTITAWSLEVCTRETQNLGTHDVTSSLANDIKIYPNPSDGNFFIKSRNLKGEIKVGMFDASGRLVFSSAYQSESTKEFNVNVPKGIYVISINSSKGVYNTKLVIK